MGRFEEEQGGEDDGGKTPRAQAEGREYCGLYILVKRTTGILLMMTESSRCEVVVVVVEKKVFLGV